MIYDLVKEFALSRPDTPAIVTAHETVTYEHVYQTAASLFDILSGQGLTSTDTAAIDTADPFAYITYLLALGRIGCRIVPITPNMCHDGKVRLCTVLNARYVVRAKGSALSLPMKSYGKPGDTISITSGTSGAQKLVIRSRENILDETRAVAEHLGLEPGHRVLAMTPLSHSFGCGIWRATLGAGATLCVPTESSINARLVQVRDLIGVGVDFVFGVPYLFQLLARNPIECRRPMRCFAGGEVLPPNTAWRWYEASGMRLLQEYGLSEGGITTIANPLTSSASIGVPIPGVRISILNPDAAGVGELVVYRPYAPTEYVMEGAADTFLPDGGIRTGDLGFQMGDEFYFTGRLKSVIVVAGLKLVPGEVEEALRRQPGVEDAAVIGVPDEWTGERPVAFIVPTDRVEVSPTPLDVGRIRSALKSELDSYKVPKIVVISQMPRTASGKVDYGNLRTRI